MPAFVAVPVLLGVRALEPLAAVVVFALPPRPELVLTPALVVAAPFKDAPVGLPFTPAAVGLPLNPDVAGLPLTPEVAGLPLIAELLGLPLKPAVGLPLNPAPLPAPI